MLKVKESLGCIIASLPLKYLGIPLGANPKHLETWKLILNKIPKKKKLSGWKASLIS